MKVRLTAALQARIFAQMESTYPNEGGGFLLGTLDGDSVTIADITQVENVFETEEQYHRYAMRPQDWIRMEDEAEARGLSLVGYYHSHPDSPAIPSVYDRDHALPNFVYIITSVEGGKANGGGVANGNGVANGGTAVEMRVWRLQPDRTQFEAATLEISG